jgi:hypothetical protein
MKKLSQKKVEAIFAKAGCKLVDIYEKSDISMKYICSCGVEGFISLNKFHRRLKNSGHCKECYKKSWTKEQDDIIIKNYGKLPRKEILLLLPGVSYNDLKNRAYKLGLKGNRKVVQKQARKNKGRKYTVDMSFFNEIDAKRSFYAGLIAAVGNVNIKRQRLSIRVRKDNRLYLENFKDDVKYNGIFIH